MLQTIKDELTEHINEVIRENIEINNDGSVTYYRGDMHYKAFNQDYYIIGYYQSEQWLKKHGLNVFEAIGICQEFEKEQFGELQTTYDNAETLVNDLVYWYGLEICNELELT